MTARLAPAPILAAIVGVSCVAPATAQPARSNPPAKERGSNLGLSANNKDPIKIDADRLDVFDREGKAVFQGNVVAVQGETTMRCTVMTVFYEQARGAGQTGAPAPAPAGGTPGESSIKKIDCKGPVTVVSKDQVATGDNAEFDRATNKVYLVGKAALSQCQNVTRGERIVYDMNTGVAQVDPTAGGRVQALFVPGGKDQDKQGCPDQPGQAAKPAPAAAPAVQAKPAPTPARPTRSSASTN